MSTTAERIRIAVGTVAAPQRHDLVETLVGQVQERLEDTQPTVCLLFASAHFEREVPELADKLFAKLGPRAMIGATSETVISGDHEHEGRAVLAVWAAALPGVDVKSFHLSKDDVPRCAEDTVIQDMLGTRPAEKPFFILLGDPFTFPAVDFVARLNQAFPTRPAIGGMASGAEEPGQTVLVFDGIAQQTGLVGLSLTGNVEIDPIVSQGCRPVGAHMVVTEAERNVIRSIGGKSPRTIVEDLISVSAPRDVELMKQRGLLLGCAIDEHKRAFAAGDFLIRNPIGFDAETGAMHVNDLVRTGQTIQFHVRDSGSATRDLDEMLEEKSGQAIAGALLFTCNGRGTRLFPGPHHDARSVVDAFGSPPLAGMFCAGEIGPLAGTNFLHGHTACIARFGTPGEFRHG